MPTLNPPSIGLVQVLQERANVGERDFQRALRARDDRTQALRAALQDDLDEACDARDAHLQRIQMLEAQVARLQAQQDSQVRIPCRRGRRARRDCTFASCATPRRPAYGRLLDLCRRYHCRPCAHQACRCCCSANQERHTHTCKCRQKRTCTRAYPVRPSRALRGSQRLAVCACVAAHRHLALSVACTGRPSRRSRMRRHRQMWPRTLRRRKGVCSCPRTITGARPGSTGALQQRQMVQTARQLLTTAMHRQSEHRGAASQQIAVTMGPPAQAPW